MSRRHVVATKSMRVYRRIFVKIFVSATEFCRSNMLQKFKSNRICANCCGDKILLQRQIFSQKFSSTHEAICRCDVSSGHVCATSRRTCTHGVICRHDLLLQLVALCVPTLRSLCTVIARWETHQSDAFSIDA